MSKNHASEAHGKLHWWEHPVRMMRVDYAPDFSKVMRYDLDALAKSRRDDWQINCEWIVGVPGFRDAGHTITFEAPGYDQFPGFEGSDYLRSYTPFAHKYGIRVVAYLNAHYYSRAFADSHPDWEQITCRGASYGSESPLYGNGSTLCLNTPWRDWMLKLIGEAVKTGIDGVFLDGPDFYPDCCYCEHCRAKFRAVYDAAIPQEDWANPLWRKFIAFRDDSSAEFLQDASDIVKGINPEAMIFINAGSWRPQSWRIAHDILKTQPHQQVNGAESFYYYGTNPGLFDSLMTGKYLRAGDNPSVVFTHYMNGSYHYRLLPAGELLLALYQTASSGCNPWIALFNCAAEYGEGGNEPVREIFGFMAQNEEYYTGVESIADVAILFSINTSRFYLSNNKEFLSQGGGKEEDLILSMGGEKIVDQIARKRACEQILHDSLLGYFSALTRAHIPFDALMDNGIGRDRLAKYKTLIIPDASCLSAESVLVLREFVKEGGCLLASFEAGMYDELGNSSTALFDVLGIESVDGMFPVAYSDNYLYANEDHLGIKSGSLIERAPHAMKVRSRSSAVTPEQVMEPTEGAYLPLKGLSEYPGLIMNAYGKGRTAYFAEAIGPFCKLGLTSAEDRICGTLRELCGGFSLEVSAPRTVSVESYRKMNGNCIIVHLTNNSIDGRPARQFLPVYDISISLPLDANPRAVHTLREKSPLSTAYENGYLTINVMKLNTYEVIIVDL